MRNWSLSYRLLLWLLALLPAANVAAQVAATDSLPARKRVAVVFSGGGAFGAIHVGALKVIEQAGMPVDMVVGTSMGSIVGALYSVGYDSGDIATILLTTDWAELFLDNDDQRHLTLSERDNQNTYLYQRDFYVRGGIDPKPGGVIRGDNVERTLERMLYGHTDSIDFLQDLPRQFACIATDLVTDDEVVLTHGSLVKSIRASMSIPGVFTPVHWGDMVLVDGGAKNNFAADVARRLGADIVIGVKFDLGLGTDKQYRTLIDVIERSAGSDVSRRARENEKYCDLLIKVPVRGYTSGSFTHGALNSLMERGEKATLEKLDSLLLLKSQLGTLPHTDHTLHLRDIQHMPLTDNDTVGLINPHEQNTLEASVGLRFDTEEIAAMQLGGRYFLGRRLNTELNLTVRLGMRSMLRVGVDVEPWAFIKIGGSYEFWYKNFDLYTDGRRSNNLSFLYQQANIKLLSFNAMNFDCELRLGWEHYHHFKGLWNEYSTTTFEPNEYYFNYHVRLRYNNEDRHYFTRKGIRAEARYAYCTDNFAHWQGHTGFSDVMAMCQGTFALARNTHLRPRVQGRLLFGDHLPVMAGNVAGGMTYGKFFPQQLPLEGFGHAEFFDTKFLSAALRLQQRITGRHYLLLDGSVAGNGPTLSGLFNRKPIWGVEATYAYNTGVTGPLAASLGWSTHTHRIQFFLSLGFDF